MLVRHGVNVLKSGGVPDVKLEQKSFELQDNPIAAGEDRSLEKKRSHVRRANMSNVSSETLFSKLDAPS